MRKQILRKASSPSLGAGKRFVILLLSLINSKFATSVSVRFAIWLQHFTFNRALVQKSNLKVMYQDWRSDNFDTRTNAPSVVCHNEKVTRKGGPLFFDSGLKVWDEIFQDKVQWPSVALMSTGNDMWGFGAKQYDINKFIKRLPPHWTGTLFLTEGAFSARLGGRGYANEVTGYMTRTARSILPSLSTYMDYATLNITMIKRMSRK